MMSFYRPKEINHRKLPSICLLQQHGKSMSGISFFFHRESARVASDVIFVVCSLSDSSFKPISAREFLTVIVKLPLAPDSR